MTVGLHQWSTLKHYRKMIGCVDGTDAESVFFLPENVADDMAIRKESRANVEETLGNGERNGGRRAQD